MNEIDKNQNGIEQEQSNQEPQQQFTQPQQPQQQFQQPQQPQQQQQFTQQQFPQQPQQPQQYPQQQQFPQPQQSLQQFPQQQQQQFPQQQQPQQPQQQFQQQQFQQQYGMYPTLNGNGYNWKSIRHDNMIIVLLLAAFFALNTFAQAIILFIQVVLSGGFSDIASIALSSSVTGSESEIAASIFDSLPGGMVISMIIGEALALLIFLSIRGKKLFTTDITYTRSKINLPDLASLFFIAFGAQFVFTILSIILDFLFKLLDMTPSTLMEDTIQSLHTPSGFLYIIVFGPIMEEIVFRGAILRTLQKHGENYAIVMSSFFFGMFHVFLIQGAFAFFVGLILGYTAIHYSMKWAMVLHILINGTATLIEVTIPIEIQIFLLLAFFIVAIILLRKNKSRIIEKIYEGRPVLPKVYRIAFSGGFLITAICVVLIIGILLL